jgi:ABC-type lipoprotein release transport system permease subunit
MFDPTTANEIVLHTSVAEAYAFTYPVPPMADELRPALIVPGSDGVLRAQLATPVGEFRDSFSGGHAVGMTSLRTAQLLTGLVNGITAYSVDLVDPGTMMETKALLEESLGDQYEVKTWIDLVPFMQENFRVENVGVKMGLLIFFLVAAIGSINTMMMTVMERTKEIGTMLAMGVERHQLMKLFIIEGAFVAILGSAAGVMAGAASIYFLNGTESAKATS